MYISSTRHLGNGRRVCGSGENDSGNLFASYFLQKDEKPTPHRRSSEYDAVQASWTGTPESSDVSTQELLKLPEGELRLVLAMTGVGEFSNVNHLRTLSEEQRD